MILLALDVMSLDCGGIEAIEKIAPRVLLAIDDILRINGAVEVLEAFRVAIGLEDVLDSEDGIMVFDDSLVREDCVDELFVYERVVDELVAVEMGGETLVVEAARVDFAT